MLNKGRRKGNRKNLMEEGDSTTDSPTMCDCFSVQGEGRGRKRVTINKRKEVKVLIPKKTE